MPKKKWAWIIGIAATAVVLAVAAVIVFAGGDRLAFSGEYADELTFDYGSEQVLPAAKVVNRFGVPRVGKQVTYTFTPPADSKKQAEPLVSAYPVAPCDAIGEWTVEIAAGDLKEIKTYTVVDRVAPVIHLGATPNDVFTTNTEKEYSVPAVTYDDFSAIDYTKTTAKLYRNGEEVPYNTLTGAFDATVAGKFVFKVHAVDVYGNASDAEVNWRAKNPDWTDSALPEGYLATFDDEGYTNLVQSGFINQWWGSSVTEDWLEEYEGETGVLVVRGDYSNNLAAVKVFLSKYITAEQLGDSIIVIKYRVDDTNTAGRLTLAGNFTEEQQSSVARYFSYEAGEWAYATVSASDLSNVKYADDDGYLRNFQYGFNLVGAGKEITLYLASVTVADKLAVPANVTVNGNTLTWDAVKGAEGYRVLVDGTEHIVKDTKLTAAGTLYQVQAMGDGLFTIDSDIETVADTTLKDGYLAENDEDFYAALMWNNGAGQPGGMEWYNSDAFAAAYDKAENAIRLDMTHGYVCAGAVMKFPQTVTTAGLDNVIVQVKLDAATERVQIFPYGGVGALIDTTEIKTGWNTLVIPKDRLAAACGETLAGLQLVFYGDTTEGHGDSQGEKITVYVGPVTVASKLEQPENLVVSGNTLTWDAVANANGYLVVEDGKTSATVKSNRYTTKGGKLFFVTALGDGLRYADSDKAIAVSATPKVGYLSENNELYYQYLIWNNGLNAPGGMQWYESDEFAVAYDKAEGAVRLDMTHGYVCAGAVMQFPQAAATAGLDNIVVRVKLDANTKRVQIYPYGGIGSLIDTADVKTGWNTIVIPKEAITAACGDTLEGLQLIFYGNDAKESGTSQGVKITAYVGSVTAATKLAAPTDLKLENGTLSWCAVDGATAYAVTVDGKTSIVKTTSVVVDGEVLTVVAIGDGLLTTDSEAATLYNIRVNDGYLSENDRMPYQYLIWNNGLNAPGGMQWYESDEFAVAYDKVEGAVRLDMTHGYVCAGAVMQFPQAAATAGLDNVVVRVKLDANTKRVQIYPYGGIGSLIDTADVKTGWNTIVIPKEAITAACGDTLEGLQLIFYGNDAKESGTSQGVKITAYVGSVTAATKLAAPTVTLDGDTVRWTAVDGAESYTVTVNGRVVQTDAGYAYSLANADKGVYHVAVVADGDGVFTLSSDAGTVTWSNLAILEIPATVYADGDLTLSPVTGAAGYELEINGMVYAVDAGTIDMTALTGKAILATYRVRALGDYEQTADSDWSVMLAADLSPTEHAIADFDEGYLAYVWNNGKDAEGGMEWYDSAEFAASYDAAEGGVKLDMAYGWVCAGSVIKFPQNIAMVNIGDYIVLRIKLDDSVKALRLYPYDGIGRIYNDTGATAMVHSGWNTILIPKSSIVEAVGDSTVLQGLQLILYGNADAQNGMSSGAVSVVLGGVYNGWQLDAPTASIDDGVIAWSAVDNADYYEVYVANELRYSGNGLSYTIPELADGTYSVRVVACAESPAYVKATATLTHKVGQEVQLTAPTGVVLNGTVLSWDAVATAAGYELEIDGTTYTVNTCSVDLVELSGKPLSSVSVRIRTKGNGVATLDSAWSETMTVDLTATLTVSAYPDYHKNTDVYLQLSLDTAGSLVLDGGSVKLNGVEMSSADCAFIYGWKSNGCVQTLRVYGGFQNGDVLTLSGRFSVWSCSTKLGDYRIGEVSLLCTVTDGAYSWSEYSAPSVTTSTLTPNNVTGTWSGSVLYLSVSPSVDGMTTNDGSLVSAGGKILVNGAERSTVRLAISGWTTSVLYLQNSAGSFAAGDVVTVAGAFAKDGVTVTFEQVSFKWDGSAWSVTETPSATPDDGRTDLGNITIAVETGIPGTSSTVYLKTNQKATLDDNWEISYNGMDENSGMFLNGTTKLENSRICFFSWGNAMQFGGASLSAGQTVTVKGTFISSSTNDKFTVPETVFLWDGTTWTVVS